MDPGTAALASMGAVGVISGLGARADNKSDTTLQDTIAKLEAEIQTLKKAKEICEARSAPVPPQSEPSGPVVSQSEISAPMVPRQEVDIPQPIPQPEPSVETLQEPLPEPEPPLAPVQSEPRNEPQPEPSVETLQEPVVPARRNLFDRIQEAKQDVAEEVVPLNPNLPVSTATVSRPLPALPPRPPSSLRGPNFNPDEERTTFDTGTTRKRGGLRLTRKKKLRTRRATKQKNVRRSGRS